MKSVVERMFFILCVFYCNLLFIQDNITDKKTDKTLTRKKAIEMQELIRDHFNKFMTKLEVVAKKLKIQNVEYARRLEIVKQFVKDSGVFSDLETILSALKRDDIKLFDALTAIDNFTKKLDEILGILENKLKQQDLQKKLEKIQNKIKQLQELEQKQKELIEKTKGINEDIKELENFKGQLGKFIKSQETLKKITDKNNRSSESEKDISTLLKKLKDLEKKHSDAYDNIMKSMPQKSQDLAIILNELIKLENKMNKTQKYSKALNDLESNLRPENKDNLESELEKLLKKADNIQDALNDFKKDGNIPYSEKVSKQLKKFVNQVANFQDKFLTYPFNTRRFNRFMETLLKSYQAFDISWQLAEENLANETASTWQKAKDYLSIAKKLLKNLDKDIKKNSMTKLAQDINKQKQKGEKISNFSQNYIKNNKPEPNLAKSLDNLKNVPKDLEDAVKNLLDGGKIDSAQIDHQSAVDRVKNAIEQIKNALKWEKDGMKNEQLAKQMDKLLLETEKLNKEINDTLKDIKNKHRHNEEINEIAKDAEEAFKNAKRNIRKQADSVNTAHFERAIIPQRDVKKDLKETEKNLKDLKKALSGLNKEKQNQLSSAQEDLNKKFNEALQKFDNSQNQDAKQIANQAQNAKEPMKKASKNLKKGNYQHASQNQKKALDEMRKALNELEKKLNKARKNLSEKEKKEIGKIAKEQKKLAEMTKQFARKQKDKKSKIKKDLEEAQKAMTGAARALRQGNQTAARKKQDIAYNFLKKALGKLNNNKLQYETQDAENQLEEMELTITEVYEEQEKIYEKTVSFNKKLLSGEKTRQLLIDIKNLAKEQEKLLPKASFIKDGFIQQGAAVFTKVMEMVLNDMKLSYNQLVENNVGSYTQSIQEDILKNLETLLEHLKFEIRKIRMRSGGGGGVGGVQGQQPPKIPPLAEIKLLKTMQTNIKIKTEKLMEEVKKIFSNANVDTPKNRLEIWRKEFVEKIKKLSYEQDNLADLAEKVKARTEQ